MATIQRGFARFGASIPDGPCQWWLRPENAMCASAFYSCLSRRRSFKIRNIVYCGLSSFILSSFCWEHSLKLSSSQITNSLPTASAKRRLSSSRATVPKGDWLTSNSVGPTCICGKLFPGLCAQSVLSFRPGASIPAEVMMHFHPVSDFCGHRLQILNYPPYFRYFNIFPPYFAKIIIFPSTFQNFLPVLLVFYILFVILVFLL